ncbi:AAA family ATPase [Aliarcobacter butzleri]|uniref:AAA family ATPase n=1 Tax=Aliarcobacter butzleri TaxID=28197 RepID=UPI001EDD0296|nr:AAA family ATPase [Aliarcobacter butzleri]MCG3696643.1 AAA family ATPase [Aliarcobacter butzleri]MCG3699768.1 AAA family ATPase [Aliarcobacter butzleri]MDN5078947.1 AAA family ATPase [Aliarcobacter butzleri]MDN5090278.1 AAA family ATPase [Aliarcobacter butzleri]
MKILKIKSLNINSLKGEFEVDFEKFLKDESLFAITGPTGAGKSTILDVITCALYGRTARLSNPNELMSRHTGECYCEVEYEIKGKKYRNFWGRKRAYKKPDGDFQKLEMSIVDLESGKTIDLKPKDVPAYVEELSGLDFDRFIQSMMLAQGSFDAFLKAKENERSSLLENITGTQIYKQISQEIFKTYTSKNDEIKLDENLLGNIELLSNEVVAEKTLILNNSKTQKLELDTKGNELKKVINWLENLQKLEADNTKYIEEFEQITLEKENKKEDFMRLDLANKALNIQPIYQEKNSLTQIINQDKEKLEKLQKELEDLKQLLQSKTNESLKTKDELDKEKISFDSNSKKLQEVRTLQTKIESKLQNIKELENKISSQNEQKTKLNENLNVLKTNQEKIDNELKTINDYLIKNKNDESLKEEISLISKNVNDYKDVLKLLKQIEEKLQNNSLNEKTLQDSFTKAKKEFDEIKVLFDSKDKEYKELEIQTSNFNQKEINNRDRLKSIEKLITSIDEYKRLLESILKEENIISSSKDESKTIKTNIEEKTKLIIEIQTHIQTLNDKREAELLIAKYESDRVNLKEGEECFLCGSKEHPFVDHKISINVDETASLIAQKKQIFDEENRALRTIELNLSKLETKIESSTLELNKLSKNKEEIEQVFSSLNFILIDDSKTSLEEEKYLLEKELENIIKTRDEKEKVLAQRDNLQKELNTKQTLVSQNEQELYKLRSSIEQLQNEQTQNISKKQSLEEELSKVYSKYELIFEENFEENFRTIVAKKDSFIKNETSKKELDAKLQGLTIQLKEIDTKIISIESNLKTDAEQLSKISNETTELQTQSKAILDVSDLNIFEKEITSKFNAINEKFNSLSKELVNLNSKNESVNTQIIELNQKLIDNSTKLEETKQNFNNTLAENSFTSKEEFEKALLPKELREELSIKCKALEEKYTQIQTLKIDTAKKLSEQKELNLTDKELQTLNDELKELQTIIDELQKSIGSLEKELEINAINNKKHEDKIKELEKKKEAFKVWIKLNEMIGSASGDKFAKFAQGITLDQLIYLANKHLQILSPRYELQRSSDSSKLLEIEIIDGFQGDVVRPVSTLSGGESFIVSLSLALGLSALASQKISIDSLFLDEGFGTLDSDSLELALNALNQLQSSGKMVGVISHVEALKERIPLQIKVMPKGDGMSVLNLS